jgi:hypothetical protein
MGDSYKGNADGTSLSGAYGLWWSYPSAGGPAGNLSSHGLMCIVNGNFYASLDASMRAVTDMRAPIFYDYNNTGYYLDPASTTSLRTVGDWRSDSSSWTGDFSGKIQYHANHWYIQGADLLIFRNSGGSNVWSVNQSGSATASADYRAPIFYDSGNTAYYTDPASTSRLYSIFLQNVIDFPTSSGASSSRGSPSYNIYQEAGAWTHPYPDLCIGFHTGLSFGANPSYQGMRFFTDYDLGTLVFQVNGSSNYLYKYYWMYTNTTGFYSDTNGAHFTPNTGSSYGSWQIQGSRNGWRGIHFFDGGGTPHLMLDGSGNGGMYYESAGRWASYYSYGNNSWGFGSSTTSGSYIIYATGAIYSTGNIVAYSDARKKENVVTIDNALNKVDNLRGVYYNRIDDETKKRQVGVIAQEINEVLPEVVTYAEDVDEFGVSYGNITGLLIEAIKEQNKKMNAMQETINSLLAKLENK